MPQMSQILTMKLLESCQQKLSAIGEDIEIQRQKYALLVPQVIKIALMHITSHTLHIGELMVCLQFLIDSIVTKHMRQIQAPSSALNPTIHAQDECDENTKSISALSSRINMTNPALNSITLPTNLSSIVLDLVKEWVLLPGVTLRDRAGVYSGVDMQQDTKQTKRSRHDVDTAGPSVRNQRNLQSDRSAASWQTLNSISQVIDPETLQGKDHAVNLPQVCKYLLLASFIASRNPKETDDFVFGKYKIYMRSIACTVSCEVSIFDIY